jgi:hypothetical protein
MLSILLVGILALSTVSSVAAHSYTYHLELSVMDSFNLHD